MSTVESNFVLPDFSAPEFRALDLPSTEKAETDYISSSASFTSWQNSITRKEAKMTNSSFEHCCSIEHTLENAEFALVQDSTSKESLTFPKTEMTNPTDPHMVLIHQTEEASRTQEPFKSLYRPSGGTLTSQAVVDGWIHLEFWVIDDREIELEFDIIDEASRRFYVMEKEREEQFYSRNESIKDTIQRREKCVLTASDSDDEFGHFTNSSNRLLTRTRSVHSSRRRLSKLIKSVSMTTLIKGKSPSSECPATEDHSYGVKSTLPTEFGFSSRSYTENGSVWSTSTPKLRRNLHRKLKTKWQPVSRMVSRCYSWDGCASSVDSSSKWVHFSIRSLLQRIVCCNSMETSSDDESR